MQEVTLQLFNHGKWWDLAALAFAHERMTGSLK